MFLLDDNFPSSVNNGIDGYVYLVLDNIFTDVTLFSFLVLFEYFLSVHCNFYNKSGNVLQDICISMMLCYIAHHICENIVGYLRYSSSLYQ